MPLQCICVDNRISRTQLGNYLFSVSKVSRTITRKSTLLVCAPLGTSSLTFTTRNSRLETRYSKLSSIEARGSRIEARGSRIEARGTVNLLLSGTVFCLFLFLQSVSSSTVSSSLNAVAQWASTFQFSVTPYSHLQKS